MVQDYNYTRPRRPIAAMWSGPGPALYNMPTLVGRKDHDPRSAHVRYPAYSMASRVFMHKQDQSPGPKYFPHSKMLRDGMDGAPHYSMASRHIFIEKERSPGPAAYHPTMWAMDNRPPEYTFGMKLPSGKSFVTPGPNEYELPDMIGCYTVDSTKIAAPCYSMATRSYPPEHRLKIPGPGAHKIVDLNVYKVRPPKYSMTAKNPPPGDRAVRPGPGSHYPEKVTCNRKHPPSYTFGIKHSQYAGEYMNPALDEETAPCPQPLF